MTMNNHQTEVTTITTTIKLIDETNNDEVKQHVVNGKLNVSECKTVAKELNLTFVSKDVNKETFNVNTDDLINLKGK